MSDWTSVASSATSIDSVLESSAVYREWEKAAAAKRRAQRQTATAPDVSTLSSSSSSTSATTGTTSTSATSSSGSSDSDTSHVSAASLLSDMSSNFSFELAVSDAEELVSPLVPMHHDSPRSIRFSTKGRPTPKTVAAVVDRVNPALREVVSPALDAVGEGKLLNTLQCAHLLRCIGFGELEIEASRLGLSNLCPDGLARDATHEHDSPRRLKQRESLLKLIQERLIFSGESLRAFVSSRLAPLCSTQGPSFELHREVFLRELLMLICPKSLLEGIRAAVPTQPLGLMLNDMRSESARLVRSVEYTSPTEKNNAHVMYPDFLSTWESVVEATMLLSFSADHHVDLHEVLTHLLPQGDAGMRKGGHINGLKFFLVPELVASHLHTPYKVHGLLAKGACSGFGCLAPLAAEWGRSPGERLGRAPFYTPNAAHDVAGLVLRISEVRNLKKTGASQRMRIAIATPKRELHPQSPVYTLHCDNGQQASDWGAPPRESADILITYDTASLQRYGVLIELCSILEAEGRVEVTRGWCFLSLAELASGATGSPRHSASSQGSGDGAKLYRIETRETQKSLNAYIGVRTRRSDLRRFNHPMPAPSVIPALCVLPGAALDLEVISLYRDLLFDQAVAGAPSLQEAHARAGVAGFPAVLGQPALWALLRRDYKEGRGESNAAGRKALLRDILKGVSGLLAACGAASAPTGVAKVRSAAASCGGRFLQHGERCALLHRDDQVEDIAFDAPFLPEAAGPAQAEVAKNFLDPKCRYAM